MDVLEPNGVIGRDTMRVDGAAKVTGTARYGADRKIKGAVYAALVTAPIARGRIRTIDEAAARGVPGVLEILTYRNAGRAIKANKTLIEGGYMSSNVVPLASAKIMHAGQIVAVVVAETQAGADAAAAAIYFEFAAKTPTVSFDSPGNKEVKAESLGETELKSGNFAKAYAAAAVTVDAWYETPAQHHNPMELFQSTCSWDGDGQLTVWESCQHTRGFQQGLAKQLGLQPEKVRVFSDVVGGAFGSRGELGQATALIALAAKRVGRPVKWVATRAEGFTLRTHRAETRQHVRLGADATGRLMALSHDGWELCGRRDRFAVAGSDSTAILYACPNILTKVKNVEADRQAPGFMRAPPETPYLFAMESAMDELAYKLGIDPLDLRRRNDTRVDPVKSRPYTSRSLMRCIDVGAEAFGWQRRSARPRSMREGSEFVGYGYATAFYPTQVGPADCRVTLGIDARVVVEVGSHEIGTGIRTVIAMTAADMLGLEVDAVDVHIGDSTLPAAPLSAGSNSTASVCSVVAKACVALREKLAKAALADRGSALHGLRVEAVRLQTGALRAESRHEPLTVAVRRLGHGRAVVEEATNTPHGVPPLIGPMLVRKGTPIIMGGAQMKDRVQFAHGAHFVEVRVDGWTGTIRVHRMVGAFAAGRIINPRTAKNQLAGGQVWGVGAALLEATEPDEATGRYVNQDLAEYHVAVNADVGSVETIMVPEVDTLVNPLGIKGVGELGITGVNAAIANAVFHATGVRCRRLPIRVGDIELEWLQE